mmetsp:Transcript_4295/g.4806  ORF Transcript_4295/g.4806 Transcript_4295/m.4806 type:complete len:111 (-) Transcript_4295:664-996(-)
MDVIIKHKEDNQGCSKKTSIAMVFEGVGKNGREKNDQIKLAEEANAPQRSSLSYYSFKFLLKTGSANQKITIRFWYYIIAHRSFASETRHRLFIFQDNVSLEVVSFVLSG